MRAIRITLKLLLSLSFRTLFKLQCVFNRVSIGGNEKVKGFLAVKSHGLLSIGKDFVVNSGSWANPIGGSAKTQIIVKEGGQCRIGNGVGISNTTIYCAEKITINDHVIIGGGCKIWDTDFHSLDITNRIHGNDSPKTSPIEIGKGAFLGGGVLILKGVTIGKGSIVAPHSVVTKSIPSFQLWGGVPAKFIKEL